LEVDIFKSLKDIIILRYARLKGVKKFI